MIPFKTVVTGAAEVRRDLKRIDADLPKELRLGFREVAVEVSSKVASLVPRDTGRAAASVKPRASVRGAGIAAGGARAPYYPWLDFGGNAGPGKRIHRPFIREGRYLYPTIVAEREAIRDAASETFEKVARHAGFEVRNG